MERRLTSPDVSGAHSADAPAGHLGGAPALVALREPTRPVDLVPAPVVQHPTPEPRPVRIRRRAWIGTAAVGLNVGLALALWAVSKAWTTPPPVETVPVGVAFETPPRKPEPAAKAEPPKPEAPKAEAATAVPIPQPPPAPDPHPPAPPAVQPPPTAETQTAQAPALLAPPPEPTRARTQTQHDKPPNLEPDAAVAPAATREAKPIPGPDVLSTTNAKAALAIPPATEIPKPPPPAPAPQAPRAPTETEKLAAALPTDMSALPDAFRAVLSGNGSAIDAAYKGLVYGRFGRAAGELGEQARERHLKGQVIVTFTIGDDGSIKSIAVLQSSGNPAVDALGIEMIRSAAPFPAPPPGAPRSFTPRLAFGE